MTAPQGEPVQAKIPDRELWREVPGDYYAPRIFVTEGGGIGVDVGGFVIVKPVREWHSMARAALSRSTEAREPFGPDAACGPTGGTSSQSIEKPLSAIAAMAVDLGDPKLSSTFRGKRAASAAAAPSEPLTWERLRDLRREWDHLPMDVRLAGTVEHPHVVDAAENFAKWLLPRLAGAPSEGGKPAAPPHEPSPQGIQAAADALDITWGYYDPKQKIAYEMAEKAIRAYLAVDFGDTERKP